MQQSWNQTGNNNILDEEYGRPFLFNFYEEENFSSPQINSKELHGDQEFAFFGEDFKILPSRNLDCNEDYFHEHLNSFDEPHYSQHVYELNLNEEKSKCNFSSVKGSQDTTKIKTLQRVEEDPFQDGSFSPSSMKSSSAQKEAWAKESQKVTKTFTFTSYLVWSPTVAPFLRFAK